MTTAARVGTAARAAEVTAVTTEDPVAKNPAARKPVERKPAERKRRKRPHPAAVGRILAVGASTSATLGMIAAMILSAPHKSDSASVTAQEPGTALAPPAEDLRAPAPSTTTTAVPPPPQVIVVVVPQRSSPTQPTPTGPSAPATTVPAPHPTTTTAKPAQTPAAKPAAPAKTTPTTTSGGS
jgi:hypothetical protein